MKKLTYYVAPHTDSALRRFMARLAYQPILLATGSEDETGQLVFVDNRLVAVLVRLDSEAHGDLTGLWYVEKTFGVECDWPMLFTSLAEVKTWASSRFGNESDY